MNLSQLNIDQFDRAYFIGIGGIGMSAIARYFKLKGWSVAGYDKTPSFLTDELVSEGIEVHFEDLGQLPVEFQNQEKTLVIYTPAVPKDMKELCFAQEQNFIVLKRAQILGLITRNSKALGVAGTHGKTTTSTLLAHILNETSLGCNAFLGGIGTNFNSNFVSHDTSPYTVVEADEFDRSFLQLRPFASIVTSTDADHLDIYGDSAVFQQGFKEYVDLIDPEGFAIVQADLELHPKRKITYSVSSNADYQGANLRFEAGKFLVDIQTPTRTWKAVELGIPGIHNAENAIACVAMVEQLGLEENEIRAALKSFRGVKRRFEYHVRKPELVYIDDYAHHPTELKALIDSVKLLYPNQRITGVFQPHLFTRTRDFMDGFVEQLSRLDKLILLPIYPARELPIEGVSSDALLERITSNDKKVVQRDLVLEELRQDNEGVILTIGAGDIDRIVPQLAKLLGT